MLRSRGFKVQRRCLAGGPPKPVRERAKKAKRPARAGRLTFPTAATLPTSLDALFLVPGEPPHKIESVVPSVRCEDRRASTPSSTPAAQVPILLLHGVTA